MSFARVVVIGVGLIGGSFALALRQAGLVKHVTGVGRGRANLQRALELKVIDEIATDARSACAAADLVLLATPVGQMGALMREIAAVLPAHAVLTDGGSTKQDVVALARETLGQRLPRFVPAHPIAGAELSGVEAARADLYRGKKVVLAPLADTASDALEAVRRAWQACGARVFEMTPELHDRTFAAVSHLPHLLAFALVDEIAAKPHADVLFQYAASGFRDFTRIAGSSPEMWRDISLANRGALLTELDEYTARLAAVRGMLADADGKALEAVFVRARAARQAWLDAIESPAPSPRDA